MYFILYSTPPQNRSSGNQGPVSESESCGGRPLSFFHGTALAIRAMSTATIETLCVHSGSSYLWGCFSALVHLLCSLNYPDRAFSNPSWPQHNSQQDAQLFGREQRVRGWPERVEIDANTNLVAWRSLALNETAAHANWNLCQSYSCLLSQQIIFPCLGIRGVGTPRQKRGRPCLARMYLRVH